MAARADAGAAKTDASRPFRPEARYKVWECSQQIKEIVGKCGAVASEVRKSSTSEAEHSVLDFGL